MNRWSDPCFPKYSGDTWPNIVTAGYNVLNVASTFAVGPTSPSSPVGPVAPGSPVGPSGPVTPGPQ